MLDMLRKRQEDEEGFTLIELMVVVLIIAILLAIAIPTFLGARDRANDRAAQSSARNGLTAAKVLFTDAQTYAATPASLQAEEPSLTFQATVSDTFKEVSVENNTGNNEIGIAVWSKSRTCYLLKDFSGSGGGTHFASHKVAANCTGAVANSSITTASPREW